MTYTNEMRQDDAVIAAAMGTHVWLIESEGLIAKLGHRFLCSRVRYDAGRFGCPVAIAKGDEPIDSSASTAPAFHEDRDALHRALFWAVDEWDRKRWQRFERILFDGLEGEGRHYETDVQAALITPPHIVAAALAAAIKEQKQ